MSQPITRITLCSVRRRAASAWVTVVLAGCAAPHKPPTPVPTASTAEIARPVFRDAEGPAVQREQTVPPVAVASLSQTETPSPAPMPATMASDPVEPLTATDAATAASVPGKGRPFATGMASWYGPRFHGRRTASGERYDMHAFTAAHRTLPFGTRLRVRSVHTGQEVVVRINDRGPHKHQRIIDLSRAAMLALGTLERGVTEVELLRE